MLTSKVVEEHAGSGKDQHTSTSEEGERDVRFSALEHPLPARIDCNAASRVGCRQFALHRFSHSSGSNSRSRNLGRQHVPPSDSPENPATPHEPPHPEPIPAGTLHPGGNGLNPVRPEALQIHAGTCGDRGGFPRFDAGRPHSCCHFLKATVEQDAQRPTLGTDPRSAA
jgi:hypothetical protein